MTLLAPPPYRAPQKPSFARLEWLAVVIAATLLLHGGIALFALLYKAKLPPPVKKEVSIRLGPRKKTKVLAEVGKPTKTAGRGAGGSSTGTAPAKQPPGPPSSKPDKPAGLSEKDKQAIAKKTEELMRGMDNILKAGGSNPGGDFEGAKAGPSTGAGGSTSLTQTKGTEGTGTVQGNGTLATTGPRDGIRTDEKTEHAVKAPKSSDEDDATKPNGGPHAYSSALISDTFKAKKQGFTSCYDSALKRNPASIDDHAVLLMTIVGGKPKKVSIAPTGDLKQDELFVACIREHISQMMFPKLDASAPPQPIKFTLFFTKSN